MICQERQYRVGKILRKVTGKNYAGELMKVFISNEDSQIELTEKEDIEEAMHEENLKKFY